MAGSSSYHEQPRLREISIALELSTLCLREEASGRVSEITEQQIGTQAFGRHAAYNPGDDNIVRNYARILRQRPDDFYAEEGRDETLRIGIPRGCYVPQFEQQTLHAEDRQVAIEALPKLPAVLPTAPSIGSHDLPTGSQLLGKSRKAMVTVAVGTLLLILALYVGRRAWIAFHPDAYTEFWNEVLTPGRSNVVVLADSGLGVLQDLTELELDCMSMHSETHLLYRLRSYNVIPRPLLGLIVLKT